MKGAPFEQVPGKSDRRVPVAIDSVESGVQVANDGEEEVEQAVGTEDEETTMQFKGGHGKSHVSRKIIDRYGATEGCPACTSTARKGTTSGNGGVNQNDTCRQRVITAMRRDPQYRPLAQKHDGSIGAVQNDDYNNSTTIPKDTRAKFEERRGHVRKAVHAAKQKLRNNMTIISTQLDQRILIIEIVAMDVAEFCSPPPTINIASEIGLRAGGHLDLTAQDVDG